MRLCIYAFVYLLVYSFISFFIHLFVYFFIGFFVHSLVYFLIDLLVYTFQHINQYIKTLKILKTFGGLKLKS